MKPNEREVRLLIECKQTSATQIHRVANASKCVIPTCHGIWPKADPAWGFQPRFFPPLLRFHSVTLFASCLRFRYRSRSSSRHSKFLLLYTSANGDPARFLFPISLLFFLFAPTLPYMLLYPPYIPTCFSRFSASPFCYRTYPSAILVFIFRRLFVFSHSIHFFLSLSLFLFLTLVFAFWFCIFFYPFP